MSKSSIFNFILGLCYLDCDPTCSIGSYKLMTNVIIFQYKIIVGCHHSKPKTICALLQSTSKEQLELQTCAFTSLCREI